MSQKQLLETEVKKAQEKQVDAEKRADDLQKSLLGMKENLDLINSE
jgi:hypothetical protein